MTDANSNNDFLKYFSQTRNRQKDLIILLGTTFTFSSGLWRLFICHKIYENINIHKIYVEQKTLPEI